MKISVIVLHYQNVADTLECLESLKKQNYDNYEILLIDNGSGELGNIALPVKLIKNTENLGFAEGGNIGIRAALENGADAVLLFNNDAVADPGLLSAFARAAKEHPGAGAFGAKIYYYDEPTQIWHAGGNVSRTYRCYHEGCLDCDLDKEWDVKREIAYACGCAIFVTKKAIEKVGLMENQFFLLWEEIDWCWRVRKAGLQCLYIPEAKVWHKISQSFEGGNRGPLWQYYYFRNRLLFLKRNYSWKLRARFYCTIFLRELTEMIGISLSFWGDSQQKQINKAALKGVWDFFMGQFGPVHPHR